MYYIMAEANMWFDSFAIDTTAKGPRLTKKDAVYVYEVFLYIWYMLYVHINCLLKSYIYCMIAAEDKRFRSFPIDTAMRALGSRT